MQDKIDDASYHEGRAAFGAGASLRSIIEQCQAANSEADEIRSFSGTLGFLDALLDRLRAPVDVGRSFRVGAPVVEEG